MRFDILSLFPNLVLPYTQDSILKRAQEAGHIEVHAHNIRDYSMDKHNNVDDTPYGGGAGMVMTCQPLFDAIRDVKKKNPNAKVLYMSPQGKTLNQKKVEELAKEDGLILLCGRYEGIDNRVREALVDEEVSIGNYVLTGGELASLIVIDSVSRFIPGVLGKNESAEEDSFSDALEGLKEYPHYTKPEEFEGMKVPEVLRSGNHGAIREWRMNQRKALD